MPRPNTFFGVCCLLYLFFNPNFNFGQEKVLSGIIQNPNNDLANVLVVNLNSKESTITDALGEFTIEVQLGDSLRFTAVQYRTKKVVITDSIFFKKTLVVNLVENVINLNEVTVTPYNLTGKIDVDIERLAIEPVVTASTLDLPNANIKKMTQSERLLIEADRGKFIEYAVLKEYGIVNEIISYATLPIKINTHKIMNKVSGRTKSLKNMVARDQKIELEKEIIAKFSKKTISEDFKIPETNIDGFLTYCMSQKDFLALSQVGNTAKIWEYLKAKSIEFKGTHFVDKY